MVKETLPGRGIWWVRAETRDEEGVGKGREASATAAAELVAAMPRLLGGGRGRVGAFWLFRLKLGVFFLIGVQVQPIAPARRCDGVWPWVRPRRTTGHAGGWGLPRAAAQSRVPFVRFRSTRGPTRASGDVGLPDRPVEFRDREYSAGPIFGPSSFKAP
jgi:hypothetical protein